MMAAELRAAREANPFTPFTIRMADGRSFPVPHRDYLSVAPNGRVALAYGTGREAAWSVLDTLLITELTFETVASPPATPAAADPS